MSFLEQSFKEMDLSPEELKFLVKSIEYSKILREFTDSIDENKYFTFDWDCNRLYSKLKKVISDVLTRELE